MSIQSELLGHICGQVPEQARLAVHLGGDGRVCCYYLCPFSTLRMIVREGIKCRSSQPACVDLSSPDVQSRRKTVWLGYTERSGKLRKLPDMAIHSCVNLFWNPCNQTFDAFQRNGLLRAAEKNDSEHGIMCLLEIDTERLLNVPDVYWTVTKGNAASGGFASFEMQYLRQFPWTKTYAMGPYTLEYPWQPRAAELIVCIDPSTQGYTKPIPPSCFSPGQLHLPAVLRGDCSVAG